MKRWKMTQEEMNNGHLKDNDKDELGSSDMPVLSAVFIGVIRPGRLIVPSIPATYV